MNKLLLLILLAQAVRFSIDNPACGSVDAATGILTTPAQVPTAANCKVIATSTVDQTKSDTAIVSLAASPQPIAVTISPKTVRAKPGESVQFTATVTGGSQAPPAGTVFHYLPGYPVGCPRSVSGNLYPPNQQDADCAVPTEIPLAQFPIPPTGGFYTDHNFGYQVRVISQAGDASHAYSSLPAGSATSKFAMIDQVGVGSATMVDLTTGVLLGTGAGHATFIRLSPTDDNLYYFPEGNQIKRYRIKEKVTDTAVNAPQFQKLCDGGTGKVVRAGWYGVWPNLTQNECTNISTLANKQVCVVNVLDGRVLCGALPAEVHNVQFVMPAHGRSPNGKDYVWVGAFPRGALYTINEAQGKLDFITSMPDYPSGGNLDAPHADVAHDDQGRQYIFLGVDTPETSGPSIVLLPLDAEAQMVAQRIIIMHVYKGGGTMPWPASHYGCSPNAPVCVYSSMYDVPPYRDPLDLTTPLTARFGVRGNYVSEVIAMKFFGTGTEVRRLSMNRSMQWTTDQYYSTPRAALSGDGRYAIYTTNFGHPPPAPKRVVAIATGW